MIGIFDRSQYEDVLIARVDQLITKQVWSRRYGQINAGRPSSSTPGLW